MSTFPIPIQIGQGLAPNELDLDHPGTGDQFKRFRDRDEHMKSILSDGAAAPEELNVSTLKINGVNIGIPFTQRIGGLSVANGSYSLSSDFTTWPLGFWANVLWMWWYVGESRVAMINAGATVAKVYLYGAVAYFRLIVDNVERNRFLFVNDWHSGSGFDYWRTGLHCALPMSSGWHWGALQFYLAASLPAGAAHLEAPDMDLLIV